MKRLESLLNSRIVLIFTPLVTLFLWGFFVGPIHGLLNQFVLAGLIEVEIIFAIAGMFFFITRWCQLIGARVSEQQLKAARSLSRTTMPDGSKYPKAPFSSTSEQSIQPKSI